MLEFGVLIDSGAITVLSRWFMTVAADTPYLRTGGRFAIAFDKESSHAVRIELFADLARKRIRCERFLQ